MPDMKDRKGKKNKKKLGMSEPVDLEAGEQVAEPEAPSVAKAVYDKSPDNGADEFQPAAEITDSSVTNPLENDTTVDASTPVATLNTTRKTSIPPPPKAKAKIHNIDVAIEVTDKHGDQLNPDATIVPDITVTQADTSHPPTHQEPEKYNGIPKNKETSLAPYREFVLEFAASGVTEGQTLEVSKQKKPAKEAADVARVTVPGPDATKIKAISKDTANDLLQADSAAKQAKHPVRAGSSKVDNVKGVPEAKLQLMSLVSEISILPQLPK
jgi:hypothetical protein